MSNIIVLLKSDLFVTEVTTFILLPGSIADLKFKLIESNILFLIGKKDPRSVETRDPPSIP